MCGRFGLTASPKLVAKQIRLVEEPTLLFRYNIAPAQLVAAVRKKPDAAERKLDMLRWGLVPFWAKDLKIGNRLINARAETVSKKPAFRASFRQKRCLIPAEVFMNGSTWKKGSSHISSGCETEAFLPLPPYGTTGKVQNTKSLNPTQSSPQTQINS